jgi:hypothetical protein
LALALWAFAPGYGQAEEHALQAFGGRKVDVVQLLSDRPLELHTLLGAHLGQLSTEDSWEGLPVAGEYNNPNIRYLYLPGVLKTNTKRWDFMFNDVCVSDYSLFIIFFNRGYVFKVELRYVSDDFKGVVDPNFGTPCTNQRPIFDSFAAKIGGSPIQRGNALEITEIRNGYVQVLSTEPENADLSWTILGAPQL